MADSTTVENAIMYGREHSRQMQAKFDEKYYAPVQETVAAMMWQSMSPEMKAYFEQQKPALARAMEKRYGTRNV